MKTNAGGGRSFDIKAVCSYASPTPRGLRCASCSPSTPRRRAKAWGGLCRHHAERPGVAADCVLGGGPGERGLILCIVWIPPRIGSRTRSPSDLGNPQLPSSVNPDSEQPAVSLSAHLRHVAAEAERLCEALGVTTGNAEIVRVACWHDVGKSHPAFQEARPAPGSGSDRRTDAHRPGDPRRHYQPRHRGADAAGRPRQTGAVFPSVTPDEARVTYLWGVHGS